MPEVMPTDLAFSDIIPMAEPLPRPRNVGLTEVRTPAHSVSRIAGYVDTLGPYLDSVKWTVGSQRLVTRAQVKEVNDFLHANQIEVSSGGLLEAVLPLGERAVIEYLEQSKALGFDIIEISTSFVALSLEDKCNIVRRVVDLGLKPKPEVTAWVPMDRQNISAAKIVRETEAVLEAGAWKVMIEEDGIFATGNDANDSKTWKRDLVWQLAARIPQERLYWEASNMRIFGWLINSFGADVNVFTGDEHLGFLASFRAGVFGLNVGTFRDGSPRGHS